MAAEHVLVIGSAGIDIKARAPLPLEWHSVYDGEVRNTVGGVARNIAENLARLDVTTTFLSAVGTDAPGKRVLAYTRRGGVDCAHVLKVRGARTCGFVSIAGENGEPGVVIKDYDVTRSIDPNYLWKHEDLFARAALIVIDASLSESTLATVFELAARYNLRVCADPTSPRLADRLCPYLDKLYMVAPNAAETTALCGVDNPALDRDTAIDAARMLVSSGVQIAVVTLGDLGVAYAHGSGAGFIRAAQVQVVDPSGAGDAFSGAVIFGLLNNVEIDEAMRLGMTAAALTLQSRETVLPGLSQELLYDKLMV